jgi:hypothetical protein
MFKHTTAAALTLFVLAGCGTATTPLAAQSQNAAIAAQGKKKAAPDRPVQMFDRLIGMLSVHEESGQVMFEFGTKGLIFKDAVRKNPTFTINGKDFLYQAGVRPGTDGKLYLEDDRDGKSKFYLLGTYEIPKDRAKIEFRQACGIKFDMQHTFKVKRPLNPMAHITFEIDLKSEPKLVTEVPKSLSVR